MKKNLFLRLCLMMAVSIFIYSCRTDQFPEAEAYNNSSKFQLTSKRISLNEAKHKAQLVAELDNVESKLKTISKANVHGKVIDYGNGVSIDTDDVIYTENGPNYHNYTFYINRENAPADAPLENLVLTPMTNGLYKELLVSYNLTSQEKQTMMNGGFIDTKGKVTITELAQNTYNPLAKGMTSCGWQEEDNFAIACSSGDHHMGNVESWGSCTASRKPGWYTTTVYRCNFIYDDNDTGGGGWWVGEGGGTENGGGGSQQPGDGTTEPCNGNTTSPTDPNTNIGEGGCSGIPAPINVPSLGIDPCRKAKTSITSANNILKTPNVQSKMDAVLKGKTQATNEWAVAVEQKPDGTYDASIAKEGTKFESSVPPVEAPNIFIGDGHSHAGAPGRPSGGDFYEMLKALLTNASFKYRYVYGNYFGVPENYALVVSDRDAAIAFLGQFPRSENYDESTHTIKEGSLLGDEFYKAAKHYSEGRSENNTGEDYDSNAIAMAYILDKFNVGINIAKTDANGDLKKIVANIQKITIPASGGAVKEGIKVSKCP